MNATTTPAPLLAYHGKRSIKNKYITRVRQHAKADEIINGQYWQNGKGCAVGCTIHSNQHGAYETELGIPRVLARLEDWLFEAIYATDPALAKAWPERFLSAIKPGADLSMIWPKFAVWLLIDETSGVIRFAKRERTKAAVLSVGQLYQGWIDGAKPSATEWGSARRSAAAAYAAADAAAAAAAAARRKHYSLMANKLIELLGEAK